jgi:hypothetical protein
MAWTLRGSRSAKETQGTTRAAPTTDSTDGVNCADVTALVVVLEADSGQTLSGSGTVDCYIYDDNWAAWVLVPGAALTVPASAASKRRIAFPVSEVPSSRGRILYATNTVATSSGNVTVYVNCYSNKTGTVI